MTFTFANGSCNVATYAFSLPIGRTMLGGQQPKSAYTNICSCEGSDGCRNYLTHRAILKEDDDENDD